MRINRLKWYRPVILTLCFAYSLTINAEWAPKSFYTDDSPYYLKLFKDGFHQRFRVAKSECNSVQRAEIIIPTASRNTLSFPMYKGVSRSPRATGWKLPYGVNNNDYCWFEGHASELSLHNQIHYSLKIYPKQNNLPVLFLNAESHSLIPYKRLSTSIEQWITLGALGATPVIGGGTYFKVWEPEAQRVDIKINQRDIYSLNLPTTKQKTHSIYLENVNPGDQYTYHFVKNGVYESLGVGNADQTSDIKIDPMARDIVYDSKGGFSNSYINPRAVVFDNTNYPWTNSFTQIERSQVKYENWIIYQLWTLTFNPKKVNGLYRPGQFKDITEKLDYIQNLGVTAVEFLPVHESRFHASWGYALDSFTLIEKNYGSPQELKDLINDIHGRKLKVIFDVVLNHINNSLLREPLAPNQLKTKIYAGTTDWGPKPDFDNVMVRKWISDSIVNLVRDYHLDGLRFDMIEPIYKGNPSGYKFLQELNHLLKLVNPKLYSSAEQLPDNVWATYSQKDGGLGFDAQWNDKFKNFFELKFDYYRENHRGLDLSPLVGSLNGYSNQSNGNGEYHFGGPGRTVNYLGSHDVIGNKNPFLRIISDFSSYESSGHNFFTRVRPLEIPNKIEREAKFRMIHNSFNHRAGLTSYGVLFTKPGATLFFQGEELAADINIENEWSYLNAKENNSTPTVNVDLNRYISSHRMQWEYLDSKASELSFLSDAERAQFQNYHQFFKDLTHFKKDHPELNQVDALDVRYLKDGVISYRIDRGPHEFFVIVNYNDDLTNFWTDFPGTSTDWWHEEISLAQSKYHQGKKKYRNIISNIGGRSNNIRVPGPGITIFKKFNQGLIQDKLYLRTDLNNWIVNDKNRLRRSSDAGDIYSTTITIPKKMPGDLNFKLGTSDWCIDIGKDDVAALTETDFLGDREGSLTYNPDRPNASISLNAGTYRFIFNLKTFKYNFIKL